MVPEVPLEPELVLYVFLPPLLYSAALDSSYLRLRDVRQAVGLLSVGLVLFTTAVVGLLVHLMLPDLPLALAFALGAVIAPPDAVAAVAVGRMAGPPRRALTILIGESLFNDATALTLYRVAIGAALGGAVSVWEGLGEFVFAAMRRVVIGLVLAVALAWLFQRTRDSLVENTLMLLIPFAAYLAAESVHASGVIAVVVVGLYLGNRMHLRGFGTRLVSDAVWKVTDFFLEAVVFALIGLQLVTVVKGIMRLRPLGGGGLRRGGAGGLDRGQVRLDVRPHLCAQGPRPHPADGGGDGDPRLGGHARRGVAGGGVRHPARGRRRGTGRCCCS